jgi:hypothetical protein
MNVDLGICSKLTKMVVWLLLLAGLLLVGVWYLPLIQQNERMQRENLLWNGSWKRKRKKPNNSRRTLTRSATIPKPSNVLPAKNSATPGPAKPWCDLSNP